MPPQLAEFVKLAAYFGLVIGVLGTVAPVIPGPPIIWLSALVWAWADGFQHVGWPTLAVMAILAVVAETADILLATYGGRRSGAAWSSLVVAAVVAVIGFVVWNLPGALIGAAAGLVAAEARRFDGDLRQALRTSRGIVIGYLIAMVLQLTLALLMLLLFTAQAFGPA